MIKVAFVGPFAVRLADSVGARLSIPSELIVDNEADILPRLADVDVLVSMGFSKRMAASAPRLRLLQVPGAGLDRVDRAAVPANVHLANAYGHEAGIAEYIIGAMIALTRSFYRLDAKLRRGVWESQWALDAPMPPLWPELAGKTLAILGYGRIGQALARRACAFDMRVHAVRRSAEAGATPSGAFVVGPDAVDDVLQQADYLALTLPLSPATRHLIDERRLGLMKPSVFLINVARAEIVEEVALYKALEQGTIAGAALDVWYRYPSAAGAAPPAARPFHLLENVIMTPHVSGWTEGMFEARAALIADNIERTARGEPPLNAIDASS